MASSIKIKVNGLTHGVTASLDTPLLYVLHNELHLHGPRFGCGLAQCGACSVLLDGKEIRSCVTPVAAVSGKSITTLEGLPALWAAQRGTTAAAPALHPLQQAWIDVQVPHCGYCQNGMMIQAADLLATTKNPSEDQIRTAMNGHLCRCGTYPRILTAIQKAAAVMAKGRCVMTGLMPEKEFSRKSFLKGGGALIVGFSRRRRGARRQGGGGVPTRSRAPGPADPNAGRLVAHRSMPTTPRRSSRAGSSSARASTTGLLMIAAEELDMDMSQLGHIAFDTGGPTSSPNTGNTGGSTSIDVRRGPLVRRGGGRGASRRCSAWPRRSLGVPVASLSVDKGVVSGGGKTVTYGAAGRRQAVQRHSSRPTHAATPASAPAKPVSQYKLVGTPASQRDRHPGRSSTGAYTYVHNVRVPGMLHGRVVRPRGQGAYGDGTNPVR